jgi:transcription initiation factor TFIID subunit 13
VRVLDEITTDFLIETCHDAAKTAAAAGRQKVKVEDFKFAIRGDALMLGRVNELLALDRELKDARRQFDTEEGRIGLERGRKKKADKDADKEVEKDVDMEVEAVPEAETGPS